MDGRRSQRLWQNGQFHTFYLLTHPSGVWAKGEDRSDLLALQKAQAQANERLRASTPVRERPETGRAKTVQVFTDADMPADMRAELHRRFMLVNDSYHRFYPLPSGDSASGRYVEDALNRRVSDWLRTNGMVEDRDDPRFYVFLHFVTVD